MAMQCSERSGATASSGRKLSCAAREVVRQLSSKAAAALQSSCGTEEVLPLSEHVSGGRSDAAVAGGGGPHGGSSFDVQFSACEGSCGADMVKMTCSPRATD
eukprot:4482198-Prymnesium_polylepis.1